MTDLIIFSINKLCCIYAKVCSCQDPCNEAALTFLLALRSYACLGDLPAFFK